VEEKCDGSLGGLVTNAPASLASPLVEASRRCMASPSPMEAHLGPSSFTWLRCAALASRLEAHLASGSFRRLPSDGKKEAPVSAHAICKKKRERIEDQPALL